jgi:hypothetical protein
LNIISRFKVEAQSGKVIPCYIAVDVDSFVVVGTFAVDVDSFVVVIRHCCSDGLCSDMHWIFVDVFVDETSLIMEHNCFCLDGLIVAYVSNFVDASVAQFFDAVAQFFDAVAVLSTSFVEKQLLMFCQRLLL